MIIRPIGYIAKIKYKNIIGGQIIYCKKIIPTRIIKKGVIFDSLKDYKLFIFSYTSSMGLHSMHRIYLM
jgi:hypothetical protein